MFPVKLYDSGISGFSMLLDQITPERFSMSVFLIILNVPIFLFGSKKQGISFTLYSLFTIIIYSLVSYLIMHVLPIDVNFVSPLAGSDLLLCAVFGGVISGIGSGLTIRFGGAIDGLDVLSVMFAKKIGISIGTFVMIFNTLLYIVCGIVIKSWILPLYSIVTYYVGSKTVDFIVEGFDRSMCAMIVTNKAKDISAALSENFKDGITYDKSRYTLTITLVNAVSSIDEVVDGIIDSVDLELAKNGTTIAKCHSEYELDSSTGEAKLVKSEHEGGNDPKNPEFIKAHTMTFSNEYNAETELELPEIVKIIDGRKWDTHDVFAFSVSMEKEDKSVTLPDKIEITSGNDDKDGVEKGKSGKFSKVKFTEPGTYTLTVAEDHVDNGFSTEKDSYKITVKVTDDNKGTLAIESYTLDGEPLSALPDTLEFTNKFSDIPEELELKIEKTLVGRAWENTDKFQFLIAPDDITKTAIAEGEIELPSDSFGSPDVNGNYTVTISGTDKDLVENILTKTFGKINFIKGSESVLEYKFTISEKADASDISKDIDYSKSVAHTLNIRVKRARSTESDNKLTGRLEIKAALDTDTLPDTPLNEITVPFTNSAYTESVFTVNKVIVGRDWKDKETFAAGITLTKGNAEKVKVFKDGKELKLTENELDFSKTEPSEELTFRFYEAGTYSFTVTEAVGTEGNIEYDTTPHEVEFVVGADLKAITVTVDELPSESLDIVNIALGNIVVSKEATGSDPTDSFEFTISIKDVNADPRDDSLFEEIADVSYDPDTKAYIGTFRLSNGESKTFAKVPYGAEYTVTETASAGYKTQVNGTDGTSGSFGRKYDGTVIADENEAAFVNTKLETADLSITKTVDSALQSDRDAVYKFHVTLTAPTETILADSYTVSGADRDTLVKQSDGTIQGDVFIQGSHTAKIEGLPKGTAYEVSEDAETGSLITPP